MPAHEFKQFIAKIAARARPPKRRTLSVRDSLGEQMVGVLAVSLGLVAVLKIRELSIGFARLTISTLAWLNPPPQSRTVRLPEPGPSFERYCGIAIAGLFLGLAGNFIARRTKDTVSSLPMLGIALCVLAILPMYLMLIVSSVAMFLPILLPVLAVLAFNRLIKRRWG
jgi:hypothetical protein